MSALYREHERKTALLNRFRKARLPGREGGPYRRNFEELGVSAY